MTIKTTGQGTGATANVSENGKIHERLPDEVCKQLLRNMARARAMEERMIKMSKSGEGYFWIGGPGEEAFNVALGMQIKKGEGPDYDYLHLHYRNSGVVVGMGMELIDGIRQIAMTATDPHSRGRNFPGHFARREWNVVPVSSVIEIQFTMAAGTAHVQKRHGGDGLTVVVGGDAGTAEGDFASCMIWSTRPGHELPVLMIVSNNGYGISTPYETVHAETNVIDRGKAFGIPGEVVDGNDPIASWHAIERAMKYCREERKPYMLEAMVSRLHGHSSSSGAIRIYDQPDCIELFGKQLIEWDILDQAGVDEVIQEAQKEAADAADAVANEPRPKPEDIYLHTYQRSEVDAVYPEKYTGLPHEKSE
ncbi:MAG: thiamine pyrophosphate-dependent dehydrogenase E1 component subunit alpha [Gemmataceae bacterium]